MKPADYGILPTSKKTIDDDVEDDIEVIHCNFDDDRSTAVGDRASLGDFDDISNLSDVAFSDNDAASEVGEEEEVEEVEEVNVENWKAVAGSLARVFEECAEELEAE